MNLVSEIMNKVSPLQQGGTYGGVPGISTNDTTFANILDKAMNTTVDVVDNVFSSMGIPAGFQIPEINTDNFI